MIFLRKYEILSSELSVSKNCNCLLSERVVQLERNAVNNAQYHRRESIEINSVPVSMYQLAMRFLKAIFAKHSLTGHEVKPNDL